MVRSPVPNSVGVILAGGASRRMGTDKALTEIEGTPMLSWVRAALDTIAERTVVAGPPRPGLTDGLVTIEDGGSKHRGPLSGVVSVMRTLPTDTVLVVVGVDQPWIRPETLASMAGQFVGRAVVPVPAGVRQTTCAVYPRDLVDVATVELAQGGSLQSMLDRTAFDPVTDDDLVRMGEDGRSWFSVDTAERLAEGIVTYGTPVRR